MAQIFHTREILTADPARVVLLPFHIAISSRESAASVIARMKRIYEAVAAMNADAVRTATARLERNFDARHRDLQDTLLSRFRQIRDAGGVGAALDDEKSALIGAYFSHEYSFQAAALLNPSVVAHPDQSGLPGGATRFILSTRCVGEGHLSTIAFREGVFHADGAIRLAPAAATASPAHMADDDVHEGPITLRKAPGDLSASVIFPMTRAQSNGLEDLRMARFEDADGALYLGSYTAFSGRELRCERFETRDFETFRLLPMRGAAVFHKALAFFPKRIDGRYAAIGRLDHESLYYLESDDIGVWNNGEPIVQPRYDWELMQVGNCGAPIELDEGWLVITHGVGPVRTYALGAVLLDKADPRKVLARARQPLIAPDAQSRDGYAPNVIYSCGGMKAGDWLFLPYAAADSRICLAAARIRDVLAQLDG